MPDGEDASLLAAMTGRGWLSAQAPAFQRDVLKVGRLRQFDAKESVFEVADEPGGIYGIATGSFFVSVPTQAGSVLLAHIIRPGTWFGHGPALTSDTRKLAFKAAEPSRVVYLPLAAIRKLQADDPDYTRAFASLPEHNIRQPIQALADLLIPHSNRRIAAVLLRVTAALDPDIAQPPEGYMLTQSDLAQMANVSRQVTNATLRRFGAKGWLSTTYNRIHVHDARALERFVATGDA
ncbi:Crp/Fnr family transcriptional regulator [Prosthecomicrobium sp. N25]|uniref:Crp/Fnr family transcriptional regulator n=1 Tax=Prosthecomicrobium sp. N25 TaxID=3129254 RepID=UPI0030782746